MRVATFVSLALLGGCGLDLTLPEGHIQCEQATDCPAQWVCRVAESERVGLCYRTPDQGSAVDAATSLDAALTEDASTQDGGSSLDGSVTTLLDASPVDATLPDATKPDASGIAPTITAVAIQGGRYHFASGETATATCLAVDADMDPLSYAWSSNAGSFNDGTLRSVTFSFGAAGPTRLTCTVSDTHYNEVVASRELRTYPAGWLMMLPLTNHSNDVSNHNNNGIVFGAVAAEDRAGNLNAALQLSGQSSITFNSGLATDLRAWTFVATLRPNATGGTIVHKGENTLGQISLYIYPSNHATLPARIQYMQASFASGSPYSLVLGEYKVQPNTFFQLAVTRSQAGQLRAYVDGKLIFSQNNLPEAPNEKSPVTVGSGYLGGYSGIVDELQMYDRALTAAEVEALALMQ